MKAKMKTKLRKGDLVKIISGGSRGKTGRILNLDLVKKRVLVEGCNLVKKTKKRRSENEQSEIITVEAFVHISNVMLVSENGDATRLGYTFNEGNKVRFAKKTGDVING